MNASDLLTEHFTRLKADQKTALTRLGIRTIRDLLYHFPARYEASGPSGTVASVTPGTDVTLFGTIRKPETRKAWKSKRPMAEAWLEDASGRIKLMWFSQPYMAKMLADGMVVKATGRIAGTESKVYLANPEIEKTQVLPENVHESLFTTTGAVPIIDDALYAIYPESRGVSSLWFLHALKTRV